jgi:hypothetical protein
MIYVDNSAKTCQVGGYFPAWFILSFQPPT